MFSCINFRLDRESKLLDMQTDRSESVRGCLIFICSDVVWSWVLKYSWFLSIAVLECHLSPAWSINFRNICVWSKNFFFSGPSVDRPARARTTGLYDITWAHLINMGFQPGILTHGKIFSLEQNPRHDLLRLWVLRQISINLHVPVRCLSYATSLRN